MSNPAARASRLKRRAVWSVVVVALALLGLSGRKLARAWWAAHRSTAQFLQSPLDSRVFYERGAEEQARGVALALPAALRVVQLAMKRDFHVPVRVYVCGSIESFAGYGANARAGGLTVNHRIFISPKPENTAERLPGLLTHELTHLHLGQELGLIASARLPVWFSEGLAVVVSGGAGAEGVSAEEARLAISNGQTFVPDAGGLFERRGASAAGLSQHLFYRQSSLFVAYLRSSQPERFDDLIASLERGLGFETAFEAAHGSSVAQAWAKFRAAPP